jgi:S1-C subfamily serine protease
VFLRLLSLLLSLGLAVGLTAAEPEKSVIHIATFRQEPIWDTPWRSDMVRQASGSGFVIRGKRIMTNAHVISWAKQVLVHRYQDPRPYLAKVSFVAHDCDLALLDVEDEKFFDGLEPLEIGTLPKVRSTVVTYGYPAGGRQISYTRGVVSRVEVQNFAHIGNRSLLAVQTDAAINPGNSGGPVIQDDKVVGVAFQGIPGLENAGFFIPPPIIEHFLKDIEDGTYDGFPQIGVSLAPLQNFAYRRFLKLPDNDLGARIDHIFPYSPAKELLRPDDVLLQIGKFPVGSDGTIVYEGNRVQAWVAVSEAQSGEKVNVKLWRDCQPLEEALPVKVINADTAEGNQFDILPRYFVYGGLVFTPLSRDYLRALDQSRGDAATSKLLYELYYHHAEDPDNARKEPVILATVLPHSVNAGMEIRGRILVDRINGRRIERLEDVPLAFEKAKQAQDLIEFYPEPHVEALERKDVAQAQAEILKTYNVPKDRRL